jgi:hypothetical protein
MSETIASIFSVLRPFDGLILPAASFSTITCDAHQRAIGFPP